MPALFWPEPLLDRVLVQIILLFFSRSLLTAMLRQRKSLLVIMTSDLIWYNGQYSFTSHTNLAADYKISWTLIAMISCSHLDSRLMCVIFRCTGEYPLPSTPASFPFKNFQRALHTRTFKIDNLIDMLCDMMMNRYIRFFYIVSSRKLPDTDKLSFHYFTTFVFSSQTIKSLIKYSNFLFNFC